MKPGFVAAAEARALVMRALTRHGKRDVRVDDVVIPFAVEDELAPDGPDAYRG